MIKQDLIEILKKLDIPVNEGIQNDTDTNKYPRIVFWEYVWEPLTSSGEEYNTKVTYQISFFSQKPRDEKLIQLKNELNKLKIFPYIEHEYVQNEKYFHSFFAVEVLENIR